MYFARNCVVHQYSDLSDFTGFQLIGSPGLAWTASFSLLLLLRGCGKFSGMGGALYTIGPFEPLPFASPLLLPLEGLGWPRRGRYRVSAGCGRC